MNIVLIGYRGSGKTTVGRLLAQRLHKSFFDVDRQVCERFGDPSIAHIWEQHGEAAWRDAEAAVTAELCTGNGRVISLGGGAVMHPAARRAIESASDTLRLYLHCQPRELYRRIHSDDRTAETRPNLTALGGGLDEITHVLAEREPVYRRVADHTLDTTDRSPREVADLVIDRFIREE